jgi:hypothetical protein
MLITGSREGWDNFFNLRCPQYVIDNDEIFRSRKDVINKYDKNINIVIADYDNILDWFRINKGQAEIHMMALAECIWDSVNESKPIQLKAGEWHIPFVDKFEAYSTKKDGSDFDINDIKISVAMAARTSYTVVGEEKEVNYKNLIGLHDRLLTQDPPHSSPFEHCARAMSNKEYNRFIKGNVVIDGDIYDYEDSSINASCDIDKSSQGWCYNLKGFIPYRYMVDNNLLSL